MPIVECQEGSRPGYRWGASGACYPYSVGDERGRRRALAAAMRQGRAIEAARSRSDAARPPTLPEAQTASYRRRLLARVRAARRLLLSQLAPLLARQEARERAVQTEADGVEARRRDVGEDLAEWLRVFELVRAAMAETPPSEDDLRARAVQVDLFATRQSERAISRVVAIDIGSNPPLRALQAAWARQNADLIKSIDERYFAELVDVVGDAVRRGRPTREIRALIQERTGVAESRASLIARDQIAKLNGQITERRQTSLGIKKYRWSTSHDERVRETHRELDERVFLWSDPPVTNEAGDRNHPGGDYQCRCVALPVFEDEE